MGELVKGFVTLDKDGGQGDGTVTATANSQNTGRVARQVNFTFSAVGVTPVVRTIVKKVKVRQQTFKRLERKEKVVMKL